MATDVFPYNLPSRLAMIRLIQETHPRFNLKEEYTHFDPPFASPTETNPGRTFVKVEQTDLNLERHYVYRRLDLNITFKGGITIKLDSPVTSRRIVEEINRVRDMNLGLDDVEMNDEPMGEPGQPLNYTMAAKEDSLVWYGSVPVYVESTDRPMNIRILEDGSSRLVETGDYRLLEVK